MKDLETAEMLQEWILQALLTQIVILYDYTYDIMVRFGFRWFPLLWDFLIPKLKDQTYHERIRGKTLHIVIKIVTGVC